MQNEFDLTARGLPFDDAVKIARRATEEAGYEWDKVSATALNIFHRAIQAAHKRGFLDGRVEQDKANVNRLQKIRKLCGYVENSTDQTVRIYQDDATRTWHVRTDNNVAYGTSYHGDSLEAAIDSIPAADLEG